MSEYISKIENSLFPLIRNIKNLNILELGVQKGRSTLRFLEICAKNNGKLYSVDTDDCSNVSNDINWKFIQSRDDNFKYIKSFIPEKLDVIFIDTLHEAKHVKKLVYNYYNLLKPGGYIFVDDISHLPYLNKKKTSFYCEINNKETFNEILKIYYFNQDNFHLDFSFESSGLAIIKKKNVQNLNEIKKMKSRENSIKNIIRLILKNINEK